MNQLRSSETHLVLKTGHVFFLISNRPIYISWEREANSNWHQHMIFKCMLLLHFVHYPHDNIQIANLESWFLKYQLIIFSLYYWNVVFTLHYNKKYIALLSVWVFQTQNLLMFSAIQKAWKFRYHLDIIWNDRRIKVFVRPLLSSQERFFTKVWLRIRFWCEGHSDKLLTSLTSFVGYNFWFLINCCF